jgi:hypothetical protein
MGLMEPRSTGAARLTLPILIPSKYDRIVLICNAGVMVTPPSLTKQGFEQQFGVNVIGHFLLANLFVDITSRQVWISSSVHRIVSTVHLNIRVVPVVLVLQGLLGFCD